MSIYAKTPSGTLWYLIASDEVPTLEPVQAPGNRLIDACYESPTFLSTGRTLASQWRVNENGTFYLQDRPLSQATMEYVEFLTPAGVSWVIGLQDDGALYVELFTSATPKQRRLMTTVMHKGNLLWVADNRQDRPRRGY